ncbi:hypothetical protein ACFL6F_04390 [Planctomycetota bacterium]
MREDERAQRMVMVEKEKTGQDKKRINREIRRIGGSKKEQEKEPPRHKDTKED